jgi:small subunit ribosomal protein S16
MLTIRMSRGGRKNVPNFTLVATDSRSPRDSQYLEKLGKYDPRSESPLKGVNVEGIKAWIAKGAALSDTVRTILKKSGVKL